MIDFHAHILPGIDDGSRSTQESLALLRLLQQQGIDRVAATPHFYAHRMTPEDFLARRRQSYSALLPQMQEPLPRLVMGAEVAYFEGIGQSAELESLCLEGTNTLLLEMPFTPWTPRLLTAVEALQYARNLRVVLAHVERYLPMQSRDILSRLFSGGLLWQMNADALLSLHTRHRSLQLLKSGHVQILGSDCHGVQYRPPHMAQAREIIEKKLGAEMLVQLDENAGALLPPLTEKADI